MFFMGLSQILIYQLCVVLHLPNAGSAIAQRFYPADAPTADGPAVLTEGLQVLEHKNTAISAVLRLDMTVF